MRRVREVERRNEEAFSLYCIFLNKVEFDLKVREIYTKQIMFCSFFFIFYFNNKITKVYYKKETKRNEFISIFVKEKYLNYEKKSKIEIFALLICV